jgi:hypothetical protein
MLGLDKQQEIRNELSRLSDAELVNELSRQANELGIQIDLSYKIRRGLGLGRGIAGHRFVTSGTLLRRRDTHSRQKSLNRVGASQEQAIVGETPNLRMRWRTWCNASAL